MYQLEAFEKIDLTRPTSIEHLAAIVRQRSSPFDSFKAMDFWKEQTALFYAFADCACNRVL